MSKQTTLPTHPRVSSGLCSNTIYRAEAYNQLIVMMKLMTGYLKMGLDIFEFMQMHDGQRYCIAYCDNGQADSYWVGVNPCGQWFYCYDSEAVIKPLELELIQSTHILAQDDAVYCEGRLDYNSLNNVCKMLRLKLADFANRITTMFEMATF